MNNTESSAGKAPPRTTITKHIWPDISLLTRLMSHIMLRRRGLFLAVSMLMLAVLAITLVPREDEWLKALQLRGSPDKELRANLKDLAGQIGRWGDFASYNLMLVLGLWFGGRFMKSRYMQRLAVASLLCAVFAGAAANVFRFSLGRPRPRVVEKKGVEDGFYGPQIRWDYNSFPSGHTATAFGSAIPLAIGAPVIGVPTLVLSSCVSWGRMFGGQHYPTDVAVAIWIAIVFGVPLGLGVRRLRYAHSTEEAIQMLDAYREAKAREKDKERTPLPQTRDFDLREA